MRWEGSSVTAIHTREPWICSTHWCVEYMHRTAMCITKAEQTLNANGGTGNDAMGGSQLREHGGRFIYATVKHRRIYDETLRPLAQQSQP
jgi:hypothetical protein